MYHKTERRKSKVQTIGTGRGEVIPRPVNSIARLRPRNQWKHFLRLSRYFLTHAETHKDSETWLCSWPTCCDTAKGQSKLFAGALQTTKVCDLGLALNRSMFRWVAVRCSHTFMCQNYSNGMGKVLM